MGTVTRAQIDRTQTGLVLVIISVAGGWFPEVGIWVCFRTTFAIVGLIGAFLIILGRDAFGMAHSRNALVSVFVYGVYLVVMFWALMGLDATLVSAARQFARGDRIGAAGTLTRGIDDWILLSSVAVALGYAAWALLTYALIGLWGRLALAASAGINVGGSLLAWIQLRPVLVEASRTGEIEVALATSDQFQLLVGTISLAASVLLVVAFCVGWGRIQWEEIPRLSPSGTSRFPAVQHGEAFPGQGDVPTPSSLKACSSCGTLLDRDFTSCMVCGIDV